MKERLRQRRWRSVKWLIIFRRESGRVCMYVRWVVLCYREREGVVESLCWVVGLSVG